MNKTVYHEASRQWLSAAYARQLDEALAAARQVGQFGRPYASGSGVLRTTPNKLLTDEPWNFITRKNTGAHERLDKLKTKRGDVAHIFQGLVTGADKVFIIPADSKIERGLTRPFLLSS